MEYRWCFVLSNRVLSLPSKFKCTYYYHYDLSAILQKWSTRGAPFWQVGYYHYPLLLKQNWNVFLLYYLNDLRVSLQKWNTWVLFSQVGYYHHSLLLNENGCIIYYLYYLRVRLQKWSTWSAPYRRVGYYHYP